MCSSAVFCSVCLGQAPRGPPRRPRSMPAMAVLLQLCALDRSMPPDAVCSGKPQTPLVQPCGANQITLNGNCSHVLSVDCGHVSSSAHATVVTAFWHMRADRPLEKWERWFARTFRLNASLLAFLPPPLDARMFALRSSLGLRRQTCIVTLPSGAKQLPYGYLAPAVGQMMARLRSQKLRALYPRWNWKSPEMTNRWYVLLQAGKLEVLEAARQLNVFRNSQTYIWADGGLARHVRIPTSRWPGQAQLDALPPKIHIGSWAGYRPVGQEVRRFCKDPAATFRINRNHLSGTLLVVPSAALRGILPVWRQALEGMIQTSQWNNEQVMFELLACFLPDRIGFIESRGVLFRQLAEGSSLPRSISAPVVGASSPTDLCQMWASPLVPTEAAEDASCVACTVPKAVEPVRNRRSQLIILGAQGSGAEGVSQLLSSLNMLTGQQRADGREGQAKLHLPVLRP